LLRRDKKTGEKEEGRSGQVQKQSRPKACTLCRCVLGVVCMAWYGRDGMAVAVEHPGAEYTVLYLAAVMARVSRYCRLCAQKTSRSPLPPTWAIHRP
jgi:hypothetical protein